MPSKEYFVVLLLNLWYQDENPCCLSKTQIKSESNQCSIFTQLKLFEDEKIISAEILYTEKKLLIDILFPKNCSTQGAVLCRNNIHMDLVVLWNYS